MDCAKSAGYNGIKYNSSKDNVTYDLVLFYPEKAKVKAVGKPSIELFLDNKKDREKLTFDLIDFDI